MRPVKKADWNLSVPNRVCRKELFLGSDIVRSYTFKTAALRGQSALLAKLNHMLTANFAPGRGEVCPFCRKTGLF